LQIKVLHCLHLLDLANMQPLVTWNFGNTIGQT